MKIELLVTIDLDLEVVGLPDGAQNQFLPDIVKCDVDEMVHRHYAFRGVAARVSVAR